MIKQFLKPTPKVSGEKVTDPDIQTNLPECLDEGSQNVDLADDTEGLPRGPGTCLPRSRYNPGSPILKTFPPQI